MTPCAVQATWVPAGCNASAARSGPGLLGRTLTSNEGLPLADSQSNTRLSEVVAAMLKVYVEEPGSVRARELLADPTRWTTARHTRVEVRRNLARVVDEPDYGTLRAWFEDHWADTTIVELTDDPGGDEITLTVRDGERELSVDGARTFGSVPALERLAEGLDAYAPAAAFGQDVFLIAWKSGHLGPGDLRKGQTAEDVAKSMGAPTGRYALAGGATRLEYARGPPPGAPKYHP